LARWVIKVNIPQDTGLKSRTLVCKLIDKCGEELYRPTRGGDELVSSGMGRETRLMTYDNIKLRKQRGEKATRGWEQIMGSVSSF